MTELPLDMSIHLDYLVFETSKVGAGFYNDGDNWTKIGQMHKNVNIWINKYSNFLIRTFSFSSKSVERFINIVV